MRYAYLLIISLLFLSSGVKAQNAWVPPNEYRVYEGPNKVTGVKFTHYAQRNDTAYYSNYLSYYRIKGSTQISGKTYALDHIIVDSSTDFGRMLVTPTHSLILNYFWVPNTPVPNTQWIASKQGPNLFYAIQTESSFSYSTRYQDSLLTLTVQVQDSNQNVDNNHFYTGLKIIYGQKNGLVSFSELFRGGGAGYFELIQSPSIDLVNIPDTLPEMLPYEVGSEIHSTLVHMYTNKIDSTYRIRKTVQVKQNGSMLNRTDSIFDFLFSYTVSGPGSGQSVLVKKESYSESIDLDLNEWQDHVSRYPVTCIKDYTSDTNQTFDFLRIDNWQSLGYEVGAPIGRDDYFTPNPPHAYFAMGSARIESEVRFRYFPYAGGPYLYYSSVANGQTFELPVYSSSSLGVFGTPLPNALFTASVSQTVLPKLKVFPNPSQGDFQISFPQEGNWNIQVMDMKGQLLYSSDAQGKDHSLYLHHLPGGIYMIQALCSYGISQNRICIQH